MPAISSPGSSANGAERATATQIATLGEFSASVREIIASHVTSARGEDFEPARPLPAEVESLTEAAGAQGEEMSASDSELGAILGAIDDEIQGSAAAECASIMAEFAAHVAHARKHLPRHQVAAAVGALKQARKAALTIVKRNAAQERTGRKKQIVMERRRRAGKGGRRPGPSLRR